MLNFKPEMKPLNQTYSELVFSTARTSMGITMASKAGKLRKLAHGLYTSNTSDSPEQVIRRNAWEIVGHYYPDALVADRTGLLNTVAEDGSLFVISARPTELSLPGLRIRPRRGAPPEEADGWLMKIRLSSIPRALLDNLVPSRRPKGFVSRTFSQAELEQWLDRYARVHGDKALNRLRDEARLLAPRIGREECFEKLDRLIGALLGTREADLQTPSAQAMRGGVGFDPDRIDLLEALRKALNEECPFGLEHRSGDAEKMLPFFEAYFSNFIEGTEFTIDEAREIIFEGKIPAQRPDDAHDIIGTFRLVSSRIYGMKLPEAADAYIEMLRQIHATIMEHRHDKRPGQFKDLPNQAGTTLFVRPERVRGTLIKGFDLLKSLPVGLPRAILAMFLVAEVHPFDDGNGRVARATMNAELAMAGQCPIIIPTIYRVEYIASLKALTNHARPQALIRVLDFAQKYTGRIDFSTYEVANAMLAETNAYIDPADADERGVRLLMPKAKGG